MKSIHYRVWDNLNEKYFEPVYKAMEGELFDLHLGLRGDLYMRTIEGTIHCDSIFPGRFEIEQATHKLDKNNQAIYGGDLLLVDEMRIVEIYWHEPTARWDSKVIEIIEQRTGFKGLENSLWPYRTRIIGNVHNYIPNQYVYLRTENQAFPIDSILTSKENGELIIAPEGTPLEEIVGTVTLNGLETK